MNALLARKAKSDLSLFYICRILCTGVTADDGSGQDGGDLGRALQRRHGIGGDEFERLHEMHRAVVM